MGAGNMGTRFTTWLTTTVPSPTSPCSHIPDGTLGGGGPGSVSCTPSSTCLERTVRDRDKRKEICLTQTADSLAVCSFVSRMETRDRGCHSGRGKHAVGLKAIDSGGTESLQVRFGAFCGSPRVMDLASTCQTGSHDWETSRWTGIFLVQ